MEAKHKEIEQNLKKMLEKLNVTDIQEAWKIRSILKEKLEEELGFSSLQEKNTKLAEEQSRIRLEINKVLAKENIMPKLIGGAKQGKPMSKDEANGGRVNPNYTKAEGYKINCQSTVVCYEARLRGYNVKTLPNIKGSKSRILERNTKLAWINPATGEYAQNIPGSLNVKNVKECKKFLLDNIEEGKRYNLGFSWQGSTRDGHIITVYKEGKDLIAYDPQNGKTYKNSEIDKEFLDKIKFQTSIYGEKQNLGVDLYRVDNLAFNPEFMDEIMEKY